MEILLKLASFLQLYFVYKATTINHVEILGKLKGKSNETNNNNATKKAKNRIKSRTYVWIGLEPGFKEKKMEI